LLKYKELNGGSHTFFRDVLFTHRLKDRSLNRYGQPSPNSFILMSLQICMTFQPLQNKRR